MPRPAPADLSHAPSRVNVQRFLLPKLKAHRAELLQGINADRRSANRAYDAECDGDRFRGARGDQ